jgi:alanyl-tRNA synthetase
LIAEESGLAVDEQRAHAWVVETHGAADTKVGDEAVAAIFKELQEAHGPTDFLGYEEERGESRVLAIVVDGALAEEAAPRTIAEVITAATPMYGRAGGQVGDTGWIRWEGGSMNVVDTIKPGGQLIVHRGEITEGRLRRGARVSLEVDAERRRLIRLNHSATHLLHHALREVLGTHVAQKGSEVAPEFLRFDFSHFEQMSAEQIFDVERHVNAEIRSNTASVTEIKGFEEAQRSGAMALFGEKYADRVRVVHIGRRSLELCGGTHVTASGEIGLFRIVSEEALALGVRRIVAYTGPRALEYTQTHDATLRGAANLLRCALADVPDRIERLQVQLKDQERAVERLKRRLAAGGGEDLLSRVRLVGGVKVLAARVEAAEPKILRQVGDSLRDRIDSGLIALGGDHGGKANLLVMVTKDLTGRFHAGKLIARMAETLEGRGGGRAEMAQAGGPRLDRLEQALEQIYTLVEEGSGS